MLTTSRRPFLPPNLSNPMMGSMVYPLGGGRMLPPNPSPVAQASPPHTTRADTGGIQQAMAKRGAQDNTADRLSGTGTKSGVSFKVSEEGSLTGADAFKTLDDYMKKAGLNSFQSQFFSKLVQAGLGPAEIRTCVKTAGDRFGSEVGQELQQGLQQLEKAGGLVGAGVNALKWGWGAGKGLLGLGSKALKATPGAAFSTASKVRTAAPAIATKTKQVLNSPVSTVAGQAGSAIARKVPALGTASRGVANAGKAVGTALKSDTGVGAITGATNPYNGVMAEGGRNPDGSINWGQAALNTAGGALLGGLGGPAMRRRMINADVGNMVGSYGTSGLNMLGEATGNETLQSLRPEMGGQLGFALGGMMPGRKSPAVQSGFPSALTGSQPAGRLAQATNAARNAAGSAGRAIVNNPGRTAATAAATAGGGYLGSKAVGAMNAVTDAAGQTPELVRGEVAKAVEQAKGEYAPQVQGLLDKGNKAVADINQTRGKVDKVVDGGWGGILDSLMSGEGGGIAGSIGSYIKENPWLLPLLLSGVGAGGGYALGGKGGATLGGIGAPLLYALMSGQLGNTQKTTGGDDGSEASGPSIAGEADQAVSQQLQDHSVKVPVGDEAPADEMARQRELQQQAMARYSPALAEQQRQAQMR